MDGGHVQSGGTFPREHRPLLLDSCIRIIFSPGGCLTEVEVQLLPRDTHWTEHHWQPLVLAVQL